MNNQVAVITADIVESSSAVGLQRLTLLDAMKTTMASMQQLIPDFRPEIFQGDSFQGSTVLHRPRALDAALYAILQFAGQGLNLRLAVGIGSVLLQTSSHLTSDGPAYQQSGRALDLLKKGGDNLFVAFDNATLQPEWSVHSATLNHLLAHCTRLQCQALALAVMGNTQVQMADILGVKQPAIQQRLAAAGWPLFQLILARFAQVC